MRETPPGECGRKVKLKGIEETYTRGGACGLIRYTRKTLPIFVSGPLFIGYVIINLPKVF